MKRFVLLLVVVVLVVGCLALTGYNNEKKKETCLWNQRTVLGAISTFYSEENRYPSSLDELVKKGYLKQIPTCPSGGKYTLVEDNGSVVMKCSIPEHEYPL